MIEEKGWMYQIEENSDYPSFFYKNKIRNNFIYISFEFNRKYNKIPVYTIAAYIGRKRNVIETSMYSKSITGTIGVSGLIKLKECIDFFVEDFFNNTNNETLMISIFGTDSKRNKVYARTLSRDGYIQSNIIDKIKSYCKVFYRDAGMV
jgi:hypothetical protein